MTTSFESALRQLLSEVVHEVAATLVNELRGSAPQQLPRAASQDCDLLLTARDTAKRLAISERHLHGLTRSGQLPCVRVGKCVRYSLETIQKWVCETESAEQPSSTERIKSKRTLPLPESAPAAPRPKPQLAEGRKRRSPVREKTPAPERKSPNVLQPRSKGRPQQVQSEERISPFSILLSELGIDRSDLPPITNGDLRRIAEVDVPTIHGWLYLGKSLPEAALDRLKSHYLRLVKERKDRE